MEKRGYVEEGWTPPGPSEPREKKAQKRSPADERAALDSDPTKRLAQTAQERLKKSR